MAGPGHIDGTVRGGGPECWRVAGPGHIGFTGGCLGEGQYPCILSTG